eukprot:SAG22_NODE_7967_length_694_cov_1.127731_1_plen_64_part_00
MSLGRRMERHRELVLKVPFFSGPGQLAADENENFISDVVVRLQVCGMCHVSYGCGCGWVCACV